ncbi:MAG: hypothetical protein AB7E29_10830 [Xanthobacter sp.]
MPTLMRLLVVLAVLAVFGFGVVWVLATQVEPQPREISFSVPLQMEPVSVQEPQPRGAADVDVEAAGR